MVKMTKYEVKKGEWRVDYSECEIAGVLVWGSKYMRKRTFQENGLSMKTLKSAFWRTQK
jgi:hypothetical protein